MACGGVKLWAPQAPAQKLFPPASRLPFFQLSLHAPMAWGRAMWLARRAEAWDCMMQCGWGGRWYAQAHEAVVRWGSYMHGCTGTAREDRGLGVCMTHPMTCPREALRHEAYRTCSPWTLSLTALTKRQKLAHRLAFMNCANDTIGFKFSKPRGIS